MRRSIQTVASCLPTELWLQIFELLFQAGHSLLPLSRISPNFYALTQRVRFLSQTLAFDYDVLASKGTQLFVVCRCSAERDPHHCKHRSCPVRSALEGLHNNADLVCRARRPVAQSRTWFITAVHPLYLSLLRRMTALSVLELCHTRITVDLLETLEQLPRLKELKLRDMFGCESLNRRQPYLNLSNLCMNAWSCPKRGELEDVLSALSSPQLRAFEWIVPPTTFRMSYSPLEVLTSTLPKDCLEELRLDIFGGTLFSEDREHTLFAFLRSQMNIRKLTLYSNFEPSWRFPVDVLPNLRNYEGPTMTIRNGLGRPVTDLVLSDLRETDYVRNTVVSLHEIRQLASLSSTLARLTLRVRQLDQNALKLVAGTFPSLLELHILLLWDASPAPGPAISATSTRGEQAWQALCNRLSEFVPALKQCRRLTYFWEYSASLWELEEATDNTRKFKPHDKYQALSQLMGPSLEILRLTCVEFVKVGINLEGPDEWKVYWRRGDRDADTAYIASA